MCSPRGVNQSSTLHNGILSSVIPVLRRNEGSQGLAFSAQVDLAGVHYLRAAGHLGQVGQVDQGGEDVNVFCCRLNSGACM